MEDEKDEKKDEKQTNMSSFFVQKGGLKNFFEKIGYWCCLACCLNFDFDFSFPYIKYLSSLFSW